MKLQTGLVKSSKSTIFLKLVCFDNLFLLNFEKTRAEFRYPVTTLPVTLTSICETNSCKGKKGWAM